MPARTRSVRSVVAAIVATLVVLLVGSAVATGAARAMVAAAQRTLSDRLVPARQATFGLATAYVDQETGHRGFLLTGDPVFLQPYDRGIAEADRLQRQLGRLLTGDAEGLGRLAAVRGAGDRWRSTVAEPGNAARRRGPLPEREATALAVEGRAQFDGLRADLAELEARTGELTTAQLGRIRHAQGIANAVAISAAALAVVVGLGTWLFLARRLNRPLHRLLTDVRAVAAGHYDRPIDLSGPRELSLVADAVNRMRASVVESGREQVAAERELTLRQEHDRMSADLHDLTIQRVFGLGLQLTSAARRHPELAPVVLPLVEETDRIIRELRTVIFGLRRSGTADGGTLRERTMDAVEASVRPLGFTPSVQFSGPVDTLTSEEIAGEVLAALSESLSNVARHARATHVDVRLRVGGGFLELDVADDGVGLDPAAPRGDGLVNLHERAQRLGGRSSASLRPGGGGTVLTWRVPLERPER